MYTYLYLASFLLYLNINSASVSCNSGNHHPWCRASVRHQGCACGAQPFFCIICIIIIIIITITIIIIIVSFLVTTSDDYNVNGYKAVSPIARLRRMDDDIMMPSHSTLWRKRSEVTKDIEDMALPLLLLLLWFGKIWHYYYFDMKNMALPPLLLLLWYCKIWHYCYNIYYNFYVVLGRYERPAELSSEPSRQDRCLPRQRFS